MTILCDPHSDLDLLKTAQLGKDDEQDEHQEITYTLQELILPRSDMQGVEELYIRRVIGHSEADGENLNLDKNSKLSFNTFFNSFYESYWARIGSISDLFVEIEFSGSVVVEVFRDSQHGVARLFGNRITAESRRKFRLRVEALTIDPTRLGRLFVDISATIDSVVYALRFVTRSEPRQRIRLTLGICTFNREKFLHRNLTSLVAEPSLHPTIHRIIVVNQGRPFVIKELATLCEHSSKVHLIEQRNLGGSGGFTRTIFEAIELGEATHHVLMDDDAVIDARVLATLVHVLEHAREGITIGGPMLDLLRPSILYENGARVNSDTSIELNLHSIDMRDVRALSLLNRPPRTDYNAWWLFAFAMKDIDKVGLPLPVFLHFDDVEYGVRFQERGISTVCLPGIAVWHEPFYAKVVHWQKYYDYRNRLLLAAAYPNRLRLFRPTMELLWWLLEAAATHNYLKTTLMAKAVRDFLQGPSLFQKDAETLHEELMSIARSQPIPTIEEDNAPSLVTATRRMPSSDFGIACLLLYRIFTILLFAKPADSRTLLDGDVDIANVGVSSYVETNGIRSYHQCFTPNRALLLKTVSLSLKTWIAYILGRKKAATAWSKTFPELQSVAYWQSVFAKPLSKP